VIKLRVDSDISLIFVTVARPVTAWNASCECVGAILPFCALNLMNIVLNEIEARVLGALVEKDITTPDYYPLSLNALVNACNQRNNRDPVMSLEEGAVRDALDRLHEHGLAGPAGGADSRVTKYEHRLQESFNFSRGETAVLCVLLLRGPQTPGELRGRTERMHRFEDLDAVQSSLQKLMQREPPLAVVLARQPGTKESRYAHLLSGEVDAGESSLPRMVAPLSTAADQERISRLEETVAGLQNEVRVLKQQLAEFCK
jgi:uncharacterized protein YceH (UPF0502 family)